MIDTYTPGTSTIDTGQCVADEGRLSVPYLRRYDDEVAVEATDSFIAVTSTITPKPSQINRLADRTVVAAFGELNHEAPPAVRGLRNKTVPKAEILVNSARLRRALDALDATCPQTFRLEIGEPTQPLVITPMNLVNEEYEPSCPNTFVLVMPMASQSTRKAVANDDD